MLRPELPEKEQEDFLKEAITMEQLNHPNIVIFVGVVTLSEPKMIITEYMENGSLDRYLQVCVQLVVFEKDCNYLRSTVSIVFCPIDEE